MKTQKTSWICVRQQAGPLVKECRYQRPTLSHTDLPSVRRRKNEIIAETRNATFRRKPVDRLELMLALFGWNASMYTMTFDPEHVPGSLSEVKRIWRNTLNAMKRWRKGSFDYIYVIEGKHGNARYHIHLILRDKDFSPAEVRFLWPGGNVDDVPLLIYPEKNFRQRAEYLTKEKRDGIKFPVGSRTWVASRSLYEQLAPPERSMQETGSIHIHSEAFRLSDWVDESHKSNHFGSYNYASYIAPDIYGYHNNARVHARPHATLT